MQHVITVPRRAGQPRPRRFIPLGRRIAELRSAASLTQEQLAEAIDGPALTLSSTYLSNIEKGYSQPSTSLLRALARVLHADYNELATLAGYQAPPEPSAWTPPPDKAQIFRRYSALFSVEQLEAGERLLRSVFLEGRPPRESAGEQGGKDAEPDQPEPET